MDELKKKNVSLEQELRFLRDGGDKAVQELLETVMLLRQKNEVLVKRLKRVDEFIKTWSSEDQDGSLEREFEFKPILCLKILTSCQELSAHRNLAIIPVMFYEPLAIFWAHCPLVLVKSKALMSKPTLIFLMKRCL